MGKPTSRACITIYTLPSIVHSRINGNIALRSVAPRKGKTPKMISWFAISITICSIWLNVQVVQAFLTDARYPYNIMTIALSDGMVKAIEHTKISESTNSIGKIEWDKCIVVWSGNPVRGLIIFIAVSPESETSLVEYGLQFLPNFRVGWCIFIVWSNPP